MSRRLLGTIATYHCSAQCGQGPFEKYAGVDDAVTCPSCNQAAHQNRQSDKHAGLDYDQPVISHTLGVPIRQLDEARRRFPHHEYTPEGKLVIRNHAERRRVLTDLGYTDLRDS
jgi:hypothetical protein